jgi:hypothetical protein
LPSFDGELMASFSDLARSMSAIEMFRQLTHFFDNGVTSLWLPALVLGQVWNGGSVE